MNSSPSMAAIAKAANVAKSTVSLALRNDPRVSVEARERIQGIAQKMGYKNNALVARLMYELRTAGKQRYIGSLAFVNVHRVAELRKISGHVNSWLVGGEQQANRLGYSVDHFWLNDPELSAERLSRIFYARNVQGVIFYGLLDEPCLHGCESIWEHFPSVSIGSRLRKPALHFVSNDHYFTAMQACEQLAIRGYSRIGLILDRLLDNILEHRFVAGYRESCLDQQNNFPVLYLDDVREYPHTEGKRKFIEWFNTYHPDACICLNSFILDWIKELGIKIPDEMGVAFLDLPKEIKGKAAGMEQQAEWTGMTATDMIIGQILRREVGLPPFQRGILIESQWCPGPTVREEIPSPAVSAKRRGRKSAKEKTAN
ncbi:MAG: LacI family DNA-binding transcriptional regulator [Chthoniobacteraceae bacterium]